MQIQDIPSYPDVGNVGNPDLVNLLYFKALNEIRVFPESML